jgi:flagellar biosynthesis/type III secretory pathway chaperone
MEETFEIKTLYGSTAFQLDDQVNLNLKNGWRLHKNFKLTDKGFYQRMVKPVGDPESKTYGEDLYCPESEKQSLFMKFVCFPYNERRAILMRASLWTYTNEKDYKDLMNKGDTLFWRQIQDKLEDCKKLNGLWDQVNRVTQQSKAENENPFLYPPKEKSEDIIFDTQLRVLRGYFFMASDQEINAVLRSMYNRTAKFNNSMSGRVPTFDRIIGSNRLSTLWTNLYDEGVIPKGLGRENPVLRGK